MTLEENVALKKELSRRAWKGSRVGRTGFAVMLVLFALSPLAALLMHALLVSILKPWEYDSAGLVVFDLVPLVTLVVAGLAVRIETWKRCNMEIGMREPQEIRIDDGYLVYTFRMVGDRYHGLGGTCMAVVSLATPGTLALDSEHGIVGIWGDIWWSYSSVASQVTGRAPVSLDEMQKVEELHIPNCFTPDLYQTLLPYYAGHPDH